ncbi:uncharacterized protein EV420DRAFT_1487850 [Desarmillaria tabescens]|uniref:Uncharacterized protein n=1 Tax=Armillaria tabescens TaxID=1929756 RepID=A0AA39J454_ARMTA|nr:uncharacterized protein EV420DRAFT_1487850 [Desarmillaria tabescens]KAK0435801.1 hypothetical protein EV420DRAFT_1487850 [Desarmillaria tabescens]
MAVREGGDSVGRNRFLQGTIRIRSEVALPTHLRHRTSQDTLDTHERCEPFDKRQKRVNVAEVVIAGDVHLVCRRCRICTAIDWYEEQCGQIKVSPACPKSTNVIIVKVVKPAPKEEGGGTMPICRAWHSSPPAQLTPICSPLALLAPPTFYLVGILPESSRRSNPASCRELLKSTLPILLAQEAATNAAKKACSRARQKVADLEVEVEITRRRQEAVQSSIDSAWKEVPGSHQALVEQDMVKHEA